MSRLADLAEIVGFFSYSRRDDEHSGGALTKLRRRIHDELRMQLGTEVRLWQDTAAIPHGTLWKDRITSAIAESTFFIPIVTPSAVASEHCRFEISAFLQREAALHRSDLVFPVLYIRVPALMSEEERRGNDVLQMIHERQYADWTRIRLLDVTSFEVGQHVASLCDDIAEALRRPLVPEGSRRPAAPATMPPAAPDEHHAAAEAGRWRAEQEAVRKREDDERARRAAEDAERWRLEREAAARREAQARAEAPPPPPPLRPLPTPMAPSTDAAVEERAFTAAKQADTVFALDEFLAAHPHTRHAAEAWALRSDLAARDDMYAKAVASRDAAALYAFLQSHPRGGQADEVRRILRKIQPMDFMIGLRQRNGVGRAALFYLLHLIIVVSFSATLGAVLGMLGLKGEVLQVLGMTIALAYCVVLCVWTIYRRRLHPACYFFLFLVVPATFVLGGVLGLIIPAILTTRGS